MKRIMPIFYILNVLCGFLTIINYEIFYKYSDVSIIIVIGFLLFYIASLLIYFKNKRDVSTLDIVVTSIYILFVGSILLFSILYQNNNGENYNMMYFTKFLLAPHLTYIIFNLIKEK